MTKAKSPLSARIKHFRNLALLVIGLGALVWGIQWVTYARQPLPEAVQSMESNDVLLITEDPWLTFSPAMGSYDSGFIFYPGGRIHPAGYAPLLRSIALHGYLVVVPEMPLNIAAFRPNLADKIIAHFPEIDQWVIGGHSVGGTMAAQYAHDHADTISGVVIWASYPANNADLSGTALSVASIYGSNDPRVNDDSFLERRTLLPANALITRIDGGDHHQFGSYEIKPEDHHATISRAAQQEQIVQATLTLLSQASGEQ